MEQMHKINDISEQDQDQFECECKHTKRAVSEKLEEILYNELKVLDHGFIRIIDYMGNDAAIVQAARVSYGAGTKKMTTDKSLINYLVRNEHTSPFEMCEIKFHVKLPIFVARQWIRHRTANVNEYSARYSILSNEFYFPNLESVCSQSEHNKQIRGAPVGSEYGAKVIEMLKQDAMMLYDHYQLMLNADDDGNPIDVSRASIAREIARINLPLSIYTEFYWKIDLNNLLRFIKLRASDHAQFEIREYANVMRDIVQMWTPWTYEAFDRHVLNSCKFSSDCMKVVKKMANGEDVKREDYSIGSGEWNDLMQKMGREDKKHGS